MSKHTKERPTESPPIELRFMGPAAKRKAAVEALESMGFHDVSDSIPWREAFPELKDEDLHRVCLRGARARECMTQVELSKRTGIPQRHISEMENGKRAIGKAIAKRLAEVLGTDWRNFMTP